jgi:hypothetical protein
LKTFFFHIVLYDSSEKTPTFSQVKAGC